MSEPTPKGIIVSLPPDPGWSMEFDTRGGETFIAVSHTSLQGQAKIKLDRSIVTACNSHAALRAACKAVVTAMENNAKYGEVCPFCAEPVDGHAGRCVMQWVFKAIDAAEGRPA